MENLNLHQNSELLFYERAISETHLEKLQLLSQLYLITEGLQDPSCLFIETNIKELDEEKDIHHLIDSRKKMRLSQKSWDQLKEIFEEFKVVPLLKNHLFAAIHDAFVILTLPKSAVRHYNNFKFIASGTRSAYNLYSIESTT